MLLSSGVMEYLWILNKWDDWVPDFKEKLTFLFTSVLVTHTLGEYQQNKDYTTIYGSNLKRGKRNYISFHYSSLNFLQRLSLPHLLLLSYFHFYPAKFSARTYEQITININSLNMGIYMFYKGLRASYWIPEYPLIISKVFSQAGFRKPYADIHAMSHLEIILQ